LQRRSVCSIHQEHDFYTRFTSSVTAEYKADVARLRQRRTAEYGWFVPTSCRLQRRSLFYSEERIAAKLVSKPIILFLKSKHRCLHDERTSCAHQRQSDWDQYWWI
jgi:hypothetical protein